MATFNFDKVAGGEHGYATHLIELKGKAFPDAVNALEEHLTKVVIPEIESKSKKKIDEFVIGKTFVRRKGKGFKRMDPGTWNQEHALKKKWSEFDDQDFDGLVVLAAVNRGVVNKKVRIEHKSFKNWSQHYALALSQQLSHRFLFVHNDKRIASETFGPAGDPSNGHAGLVFIAYKLDDSDED
jgi:hypothetical protein